MQDCNQRAKLSITTRFKGAGIAEDIYFASNLIVIIYDVA
jgi:hypothetical protein